MYVSVYACMCVCIYVLLHVCRYVCVYVCMYIFVLFVCGCYIDYIIYISGLESMGRES